MDINANIEPISIFRGKDINISNGITITQPTIGQIEEFGENDYFSTIKTFCAVGCDLICELTEKGIDYSEIEDYDLFIEVTRHSLGSKKYMLPNEELLSQIDDEIIELMKRNPLELILKDVDLADFEPVKTERHGDEVVLWNKDTDVYIDKFTYLKITDILRKVHGLIRDNPKPENEITKQILIEDAFIEREQNKNRPKTSVLMPLVSGFMARTGDYTDNVWNIKINAFMDAIQRIEKIRDADSLLSGLYSGNVDSKKLDKNRLNWLDEFKPNKIRKHSSVAK